MAKKQSGSIFEIRPGVFAFGVPGEKATAVVERFKGNGPFRGVRGVKPVIGAGAKPAAPVQEALDKLAELTGR